ncbi:MAG TPA: hypothetical protein VFG72_13275 [Marmoricola sp.]|nr:hypothetical protein [Marmoricola sp.]
MRRPDVAPVDAFDLPDWLGLTPVTWTAVDSIGTTHLVAGCLRGDGEPAEQLDCDVLACDLAYPLPVLDEGWRHDAHQAWTLDEVLLVEYDGRLTLVIPGTTVRAEPAMEAVRRLAKAVGAPADRFTVSLRL